MPSEIYGTLYNQHDLNTVITVVKDIYAKKPESANPPTVTGGESLSDRIDKLTETLYRMDMEGKPTRKPYRPYITSPRHRGGRGAFRPRGNYPDRDQGEGWPRSKGKF